VPSAIAAIATVALLASLGARLRSPVTGLVAGVILAVHPLFVFYATTPARTRLPRCWWWRRHWYS